tara:strand:- start:8485 stop:8904 length:420 start_codon:yes stop_codon:yes gene_type:complete
MMKKKTNKTECNDKNCPIHGNLKTKKKTFTGTIINNKMQKSATIAFERIIKYPKYERYGKKRTKIKVHNPPCINAKIGELVEVIECKPLSKTINFVIIKKVGKGEVFHERNEDIVDQENKKEEKRNLKKETNKNEETKE